MTDTSLAYESNGERISRAQFYAIACDPRRSVAVEACAGAGKTWMLVSRMLRALLDGAEPHEILAITFTKKAAGEMRQRLHQWLTAFAKATPAQLETELMMRGIGPTPLFSLCNALSKLHQTVLMADQPVQVRTFHGWFAALLRSAPLALLQQMGLPVHYELLEDDSEAVQAVWQRFYSLVVQQPEARTDYQHAVDTHGRFQTKKALHAALAKRVEFALADADGVVNGSIQPFGALFPEFSACSEPAQALADGAHHSVWMDAARALGQASAKTFSEKGNQLGQAITTHDTVAALDALLTQKGEPRKFNDNLAGIASVRVAQDLALRLQAAIDQHAAWQHQQCMARLARLLIAEFANLKRERGWVDMNDVERAALLMLSDPVLSGWVQERLDGQVRHLLIDEFQDTNPLQWQALSAWLSGYAGAGGSAPSVFIVGDPKQSIYRFRRAEPQVFRAAQQFVVDGLGGDLLSCDHTHRNAQRIMSVVNQAMAAAQASGEYDGYREHSTESSEQGTVACLPQIARESLDADEPVDPLTWRDSLTTPRELPEETLRTRECRQVAQCISHALAAGHKPGHIMVLARKRDRLAAMQDELRALHIPAQQPEKNDLAEAPEVQDLLALLDVLVSPAHDLSLARALKSPLFGADDGVLVQLALRQRQSRADGATASWWELLQKDNLTNGPVKNQLEGLGTKLVRWKSWVDSLPPHDALDSIYHDGDVLARFAAAAPAALRHSVLANLCALLDAALRMDGGRFLTPYALVRGLRAGGTKAPALATADAVRLLTIHGAKGLEAPLVVLLDTDAPPPKQESMGVLVDWPGEHRAPRRFAFLVSETRPPACSVQAVAAEQRARQREELNALYVAMTRARSQLVLSSVQPHRAVEQSWWSRLTGLCEPLLAPAKPQTHPDETQTEFTLRSLQNTASALSVYENYAINNVAYEHEVLGEEDSPSRRIGKAMHRLLEWWVPGSLGFTAAQLRAVAREFGLTDAQAHEATALAQRILAGEGAWAWNSAVIDWQGHEVALNHQGSTLRLDRLVRRRDNGEWWVLDHKSADHPEQQEEPVRQLRRYRSAVQAVYPDATVQAAFLTAAGKLIRLP